jgi:hypothetical protein
MERSSLGDRMSVSFIGILAAVAYQVVMSEMLPRIAYVTVMNALSGVIARSIRSGLSSRFLSRTFGANWKLLAQG